MAMPSRCCYRGSSIPYPARCGSPDGKRNYTVSGVGTSDSLLMVMNDNNVRTPERISLASISTEPFGVNENALYDQEKCICSSLPPNQGIGVGWSVSREATR
jgi:hypothetical protein